MTNNKIVLTLIYINGEKYLFVEQLIEKNIRVNSINHEFLCISLFLPIVLILYKFCYLL